MTSPHADPKAPRSIAPLPWQRRRRRRRGRAGRAVIAFASHVIPAGSQGEALTRSGALDSRALAGIISDALRIGRGARVEIRVAAASGEDVAEIERRLAGLVRRGVPVRVRHVDPAAPREEAPRRPRIAVADDSAEMRALIAATLRADGYEVVESGDGHQLTRLLEPIDPEQHATSVDLIVSDLRMPELSGLDVLGALHDRALHTPFILITAFGDEDTHREAEQLGAAAVLDKPFDLDRLRSLVRASLPTTATPA